jgi:hypothetical protein
MAQRHGKVGLLATAMGFGHLTGHISGENIPKLSEFVNDELAHVI